MPIDLSVFETIETNIHTLEIDEIKRMLQPLMVGYHIQSPIFDPGVFIYRARKLSPTFRKAQGITKANLIYPPTDQTHLGRLNRAGAPMFYSSVHKESVFFELPELNAGDELVLTFWKTNQRMFVNNVGYTEFAFQQLGATRLLPAWPPAPPQRPGATESTVGLSTLPPDVLSRMLSHDDNREVKEAMSRYFARQVAPDEAFRYKLTVALAEMHLGTIVSYRTQFAGILYPSVRMFANGDNLALLPWFVDEHLEFRKAVHVRVKNRTETTFNIDYLDAAHGFDANGKLSWLGRIRAWSVKPGKCGRFLAVAGPDDDGDYYTNDGASGHWSGVDCATGEPLPMQ